MRRQSSIPVTSSPWIEEVHLNSGSFSSTSGLSVMCTIQIFRFWTLVPIWTTRTMLG